MNDALRPQADLPNHGQIGVIQPERLTLDLGTLGVESQRQGDREPPDGLAGQVQERDRETRSGIEFEADPAGAVEEGQP